jgi:hypothetical protein
MERRYQVFVSSTYVDLIEERREVIQVLLEQECIPAGMEMFVASDDDQWTLITQVIDLSDYYVLIVGGRYGSTVDGISYTEKEFDYALAQGKAVLAFVHKNPGAIPAEKTELDPVARKKLDEFRTKVTTGRVVKFFNSPEELGSLVGRSLHMAFKRNPAEGWVRGSLAMAPEVNTEIERLRKEIAELKLERAEALAQSKPLIDPAILQSGSHAIELSYYLKNPSEPSQTWRKLSVTWDDLFRRLGPKIMDECSEGDIRQKLNAACRRDAQANGVVLDRRTAAYIEAGSWDRVKIHLRALGWIENGVKKRPVQDDNVYYKLTEVGERYLVNLMAAKVEPETEAAPTHEGEALAAADSAAAS